MKTLAFGGPFVLATILTACVATIPWRTLRSGSTKWGHKRYNKNQTPVQYWVAFLIECAATLCLFKIAIDNLLYAIE